MINLNLSEINFIAGGSASCDCMDENEQTRSKNYRFHSDNTLKDCEEWCCNKYAMFRLNLSDTKGEWKNCDAKTAPTLSKYLKTNLMTSQ